MKKFASLAVIAIMGVTLFGCSAVPDKNAEKKLPEQNIQSEVTKNKPVDESTNPNKTTENETIENEKEDKTTEKAESKTMENKKEQPKKELSKKIEVLTEEGKEMQEATLAESDYLGYRIYVLDGFSLESEEPGKDIILSKADGDFWTRIEKLDGKVNVDEYKNIQKKGFEQTGKVTERDPANLSHQVFRDSEFWLLTEVGYEDNSSNKTSINYLVKEFDGQLFAITFHMPLKEISNGITPSLWAMVSTLEAK